MIDYPNATSVTTVCNRSKSNLAEIFPGKWGLLSLLLAGDNVSERLASNITDMIYL